MLWTIIVILLILWLLGGSGAVLSFVPNRTGSGALAGRRRSLPTYRMA